MKLVHAILLLASAASATAQFNGGSLPDLSQLGDIPGLAGSGLDSTLAGLGDMFNNPDTLAQADKCGNAQFDTAAQLKCSTDAANFGNNPGNNGCPDSCKTFLNSIPTDCLDFFNSLFVGSGFSFSDICGGITGTPGTPDTPATPAPPADDTPATPDTPDTPGVPVLTGFASNFTCETDGFAWITLNASLASASSGDATTALNSTCQALNATDCCSEAEGNFTWLQYGMGKPMIVRGVNLTAPSGDCPTDFGDEPCYQRLVGSYISVTNYTIAQIEQDVNATYGQVLDAAAAYSTAADLETLKESYVSSLVLANTTSGWCNLVSDYDVFGDGSMSGEMLNDGMLNIGCGLGLYSGNATVTIPGMQGPVLDGIGGGIIAKEPAGSYITITRYLDDGSLALCGIKVCAKPVAV
ncbi:hypothetical protein D9Q98_007254 [Chlorella vulgaris]|uniref:Uncharacterized protein n=1 Tax=Chlorella vulgaris TaxID=3077 RepID=A0A9D4YVB2_CHLVU|nr:hypothetical protein D9Q98_007254 [Chlorella vulgaris]